ncbi:MAG: hypothetical protein PHI42_05035 [Paludibacteraceae bacterium]|nr:hypothetical protein [Paludibacteraceae bacterium]
MIMYTDKDYKETKLIKQGKNSMNTDFIELADWINNTYDSKVINIYYDTIQGKIDRPRLTIIFEFQKDELKFRDGFFGNFDSEKQKIIADKFDRFVNKRFTDSRTMIKRLFGKSHKKYNTKDLFVAFGSFEPIAKDEANSIIPESVITDFKDKLAINDLWTIYRKFSGTTFFFYTDNQIEQYIQNGINDILTEKYFNLLKDYDEFNYFERDSFMIYFDSKENFDKNFKSNWFYYS